MLGSWLSGPRSVAEATGVPLGYAGQRLGLPEDGVNSVASPIRRLGATFIDWTVAQLIAFAFFEEPGPRILLTLGIYALMNVALVTTVGAAIGGRLLGIRVARLDGANPPLISVVLRTFLICLAIPALVYDRDTRGLHDRWSYTVVVRR
jgi:uncharacterized RDD family membrane protein YckC